MGTCEWYLPTSKISELERGESINSKSVMVIRGSRYGKSILATSLVERLQKKVSQSSLSGAVCFFFYKDYDGTRRVRSLLYVHFLLRFLHQTSSLQVSHDYLSYELDAVMRRLLVMPGAGGRSKILHIVVAAI